MKAIITVLRDLSLTGGAHKEYQAYVDAHKAQLKAQTALCAQRHWHKHKGHTV